MQLLLVLLLLGASLTPSRSRPSRLVEENDSETAEAEYEGNDDTAADDYLREDQDEPLEEVQQKTGRREDALQESHEQQGDSQGFEASDQQAQDRYETFSELNSGSRNGRGRHGMSDINNENEKEYLSEKGRSRNYQHIDEASNSAPDEIYSRSSVNQMKRPQSDSSINGRSVITNPEYGEMLFKIKPDQTNRNQNNLAEEADEQSRVVKQSYNLHSKNRNQDTFNYDRDRRHAQNVEDKPDSTVVHNDKEELDITNENSENAIIKTIKKLSEGDLEELLNSLPEDKKAILKKIMDKREITKKAGAVESSDLEGGQVDTSKLGGDSEDHNTESAMTSDTTETSKQKEPGDNLSSKSPDVDSGSRGSGSKSEIVASADIKNDNSAIEKENESSNPGLKDEVNLNSEADIFLKNENKREINTRGLSNEKIPLEDSKISGYQLDAKESNDYLVNQEDVCSDNEDWSDTLQSEPKQNDGHSETKREIAQNDQSALQDCEKSLEDSFPAINSYEDNNLDSDMAPLIRVKRTEKNHHIKKRDSPHFSNVKVQFSPIVESENYENEKSESEDYEVLDQAAKLKNDQQIRKVGKMTVSGSGSPKRLNSHVDNRRSDLRPAILSESQKIDKLRLGSDTDSVLSSVEGVDDNIMYNSGSRGKRTPQNSDGTAVKMNMNRRTAGPLNINVVSDNSINVAQYQDDEAFGPLIRNPEEDVNRFKRVRHIEQDVHK